MRAAPLGAPKENPATGEHGGVSGPCSGERVLRFGAAGATLSGGDVFPAGPH
jgi:hypothetical protein